MNKTDLTEGNITKKIVLFALPLIGISIIQQLYSTVDLIFVGQFLGTEASAAVGASSLIITCLVNFFNGMAIGASVVAAQMYGARAWEPLRKLIQTIFLVSVVGGLFLMVFGIALTPTFLRWMDTPESIMEQAVVYLRLYLLSMVPVVTYNLLSGVARALGDAKNPLIFQLVGGLINIAAVYVAIVVLDTGIGGTAVATVLSQACSTVMIVVYMARMKESYRLKVLSAEFDRQGFSQVLRVGVPAGVQAVVITFSNILIQAQINTLGVTAIAAFTVYFRAELILYLPILALGQAAVSFVGQNYGAERFDRIKAGNRICIFGGAAATFLLAMALLFAAPVVLGVFTKDPEVIEVGTAIMKVTCPLYFLCTVIECLSSYLRGFGQAVLPMVIVIVSYCGFRIAALFTIMSRLHTAQGVAMVYPISWSIAAVALAVLYFRFQRREKGRRSRAA